VKFAVGMDKFKRTISGGIQDSLSHLNNVRLSSQLTMEIKAV
jgi:hypothetical protein